MAMDVERLIEYVKSHVFLYDLGHKDYKNTTRKAGVWENIAVQLNENSETVKLKWKTVRDGYIKYRKQVKAGNKKVINYIWSSQLKFLDDYQVSRKKKTSKSSLANALELSEDESETPSQSYSPESILIPSPSDSGPFRKESSTRRRKKEQVKNGGHVKTKKMKVERETANYDATDHLFLSYSETFKTFLPRQKALLKVELAKLFSKAELNALENSKCLQESFIEGSSPRYGTGKTEDNQINLATLCTVDVDEYDSDDDEIEFVNPTQSNSKRSKRTRNISESTG